MTATDEPHLVTEYRVLTSTRELADDLCLTARIVSVPVGADLTRAELMADAERRYDPRAEVHLEARTVGPWKPVTPPQEITP